MGLYEHQKLEPCLNGWQYFLTFLFGFIIVVILFYVSRKMYFSAKEAGTSHGVVSSLFPVFHNMTKVSHTIPLPLLSGFFGGLFCLISLVLTNIVLYLINNKINHDKK